MGHRGFYKQSTDNRVQSTEHRVQSTEYKDASHALGITNIRLSVIHKAQTPSPAGLPLTQGESFQFASVLRATFHCSYCRSCSLSLSTLTSLKFGCAHCNSSSKLDSCSLARTFIFHLSSFIFAAVICTLLSVIFALFNRCLPSVQHDKYAIICYPQSTDPLPCGTPPNLGGEFLVCSCATCDLPLLVLSKLISFIFAL